MSYQWLLGSSARLSDDRKYRYSLSRIWNADFPIVMFVGLNPSIADEQSDDPTIRRCINFARSWQCGGLVMTNLFAWRETKRKEMLLVADPIGPENDAHLISIAQRTAFVVAAWGNDGSFKHRDEEVRALLPELHYLRMSKKGQPWHPLYLPGDLRPIQWEVRSRG